MGRLCQWGFNAAAALLVILALLISLVRALLPELDQVREQLVDEIQQRYGVTVAIKRLGASWQPQGPRLQLHGFTLPPQAQQPHTLTIDQLDLTLAFWRSLVNLELHLDSLSVRGVDLALDLPGRGEALTKPGKPDSDGERRRLVNWPLLGRLGDITLEDLAIHGTIRGQTFAPAYIHRLDWRSLGGRFLGEGKIYLDEARQANETLTLAVELDQDRRGELFGRGYLKAEQLDLGNWLARNLGDKAFDYRGVLNLELWANLDANGIQSAMAKFGPSYLSWNLDGVQELALDDGELNWQPRLVGGEFTARDLHLRSNGREWPATSLALRRSGGDFDLWVGALPAWGLQPLVGLVPGMTTERVANLVGLDPRGTLGPLKVQRHDERLSARLPFDNLAWHASGPFPGIDGLSGTVQWQQDWGWLSLEAASGSLSLDWPGQLRAPVELSELAGRLELIPHGDGWQLTVDNWQLGNHDLELKLDAAVGLGGDLPARLQLYSDLQIHDAGRIGRYFPRQAMGEGLSDYLNRALQTGQARDGQVLWHGDLAAFPYRDKDGVFLAGFTMEDLTFDFLKDWPAVEQGRLRARFENAAMALNLEQGEVAGVDASGAYVGIDSLSSQAVLDVNAQVLANGDDAMAVLKDTTLARTLGTTFEAVHLAPRVPVVLDMSFPLGKAAKAEQTMSVKGRVTLWDTPLVITPLKLELAQARGEVHFHNADVDISGLQTRIYNQPTEIQLTGRGGDDGYALDLDLASHWQLARLPGALDNPAMPFLEGGSRLDGEVALRFPESGFTYHGTLTTDLDGVMIGLPAPLGKPREAQAPLVLTVDGDTQGFDAQLAQAENLQFKGHFPLALGGFEAFELAVGQPAPAPTTLGGQIRWTGDRIALSEWEALITGFVGGPARPKGEPGWFPPLKAVTMVAPELDLYGIELGGGEVVGSPATAGWQFRIDTENLVGEALLAGDLREEGIALNADYLHLVLAGAGEADAEARVEEPEQAFVPAPNDWIHRLPRLDLDVARFTIGDYQLGRLQLQSGGDEDVYRVDNLALVNGKHRLALSGIWEPGKAHSQSRINGRIRSPDMGAMTESIGFAGGIKDADLEVDFSLGWPGAPWQLSLARAEGDVRFEMEDGHLSQVSDKGARLLSLFSLESLVRKLSLDFSDVVTTGLPFTQFSGNLALKKGVLNTKDSVMDSAAGTLRVEGWTNLINRDLNYLIAFSPALTDSVPAVLFLSTGAWTVGLGAFAVTKVLEPVIEVVTQLRYELTGTLDHPVVTEVARTKKAIPLPDEATLGDAPPSDEQVEAIQEAYIKALDSNAEAGNETTPDPSTEQLEKGSADEPRGAGTTDRQPLAPSAVVHASAAPLAASQEAKEADHARSPAAADQRP